MEFRPFFTSLNGARRGISAIPAARVTTFVAHTTPELNAPPLLLLHYGFQVQVTTPQKKHTSMIPHLTTAAALLLLLVAVFMPQHASAAGECCSDVGGDSGRESDERESFTEQQVLPDPSPHPSTHPPTHPIPPTERTLLSAASKNGAQSADQWGNPYRPNPYVGGGNNMYGGGGGYNRPSYSMRGNGNGNGLGLGRRGGPPGQQWGGGGGYGAGTRAAGVSRAAWRRYDRQYLTPLVDYGVPRPSGYAGPIGQDALRYSNSLASADARASAQSMVGGRTEVIAEGIVDAASRGRRGRISDAFASAAALNRGATASVMARSANLALLRGQSGAFADATADAFVASRKRGTVKNFGLAMADAVSQGGDYGAYTYGQAIAKAVSAGGDGQAAVAEATAEVFCSGDSYASAWSSAFAVALNQDQNGCLVLSNARALATASCGGGAFNSYADSDATSRVLGFCGLFPPGAAPEFNFSSTDGGSNSFNGKK